jgi:hypothetical protein
VFANNKKAVTYPELNFWKPAREMKIVNDQDFPKSQILESLGISKSPLTANFGICDVDEIMSRQGLMRYMIENPLFLEWILNARDSSPLPGMDRYMDYDSSAESFLRYFDQNQSYTPFWQMVYKSVDFLGEGKLPDKLEIFMKAMKGNMWLETLENNLGKSIKEMIQNVALIEGTMSFVVKTKLTAEKGAPVYRVDELELANQSAYGFKKYSRSLMDVQGINSVPDWTYNSYNPFNWIGIGKIVAKIARARDKQKIDAAFNNTVIKSVGNELIDDVRDGLLSVLGKLSWKSGMLVQGSKIKIFFSYSSDGLRVRIFSWKPKVQLPAQIDFKIPEYKGYSEELLKLNVENQEKIAQEYADTLTGAKMADLVASVQKQKHDLFSHFYLFSSLRSDPIYKWYAISNLYRKNFRSSYEMLTAHREFFFNQLKALKEIAKVAEKLSEISSKIDYPLCWPEIVPEGAHIVAFEQILPIHLLPYMKKEERPVPIDNMPEINGKIIGFTGSHEGGKTTATLAIPVLIYMAQSGLPVFGKNVKLNLKSLIGMVFLTKGEGSSSVARTLIDKMVKAIEAAESENPTEVVLVFDELGEGTQEVSGDKLGRDVLAKLKRMGVSVVFNTQITSLAEFAEKELCAQCMRFTIDHKMSFGIGSGDMEGLRETSRLNEVLKK